MVSPRQLPDTTTKHAVVAYTRALAIEARAHAVAEHVLCPGFTNPISGMFRELRLDAQRIARRVAPRSRTGRARHTLGAWTRRPGRAA